MSKLATGIALAAIAISLSWSAVTNSNNRHEKEMFCLKKGEHWSDWSGGCKP